MRKFVKHICVKTIRSEKEIVNTGQRKIEVVLVYFIQGVLALYAPVCTCMRRDTKGYERGTKEVRSKVR